MVARHLLKSGDNEKIMDMLLNRAFGKPDQSTDVTSGGEKITGIEFVIKDDTED